MIMGFIENYFSEHSDETDKIVDVILKAINIDTPDSNILKRKQSVLRKTILFVTDEEIIDTI